MNGTIMTIDILRASYSVYKKLGQFFSYTYSLTCFNIDTSVLLKVKIFEQVRKYKNHGPKTF